MAVAGRHAAGGDQLGRSGRGAARSDGAGPSATLPPRARAAAYNADRLGATDHEAAAPLAARSGAGFRR